MKKKIVCAALMLAVMLTACGNSKSKEAPSISVESTDTESESTTEEDTADKIDSSEAYAEVIDRYALALSEQWNGSECTKYGMSIVLIYCYEGNPLENIGYIIMDLDNDGTDELIFGATEKLTDSFYGKFIFDIYTLDENGEVIPVVSSVERSRYYYIGDGNFAHEGSSSAADTVNVIVKYEAGALINTGIAPSSRDFVQLDLLLMSPIETESEETVADNSDTSELTLPILDEINENISVGTAGSYAKAVQTAVDLLDWGVGTGLDPEEIKTATIAWMSAKGSDEQALITEKMMSVDEAYLSLIGEGAEDLLVSAGCENTAYPWSDTKVESIEAIMEAVGLR